MVGKWCRKYEVVTTLDFGRSNDVWKTTLWRRCSDVTRRHEQKTTKNQRCHNVVCQLGCYNVVTKSLCQLGRAPRRNWHFVKPHKLQVLNLSFSKGFYESFVSKAQILSKSLKPFWSLDSRRGTVIHPPSNDKGLREIRYRISITLDARECIFGSKQWLEFRFSFIMTLYYKILFY